MVDRTVTVRLRLDSTAWATGAAAANASNRSLVSSAQAAATAAQTEAQRTAVAVQGTFSNMARSGDAALRSLAAAATTTSRTAASAADVVARQTSAAANTAAEATVRAGAAATAATGQTAAAATAAAAATTSAGTAAAATIEQVAAAAVAAAGQTTAAVTTASAAASASSQQSSTAAIAAADAQAQRTAVAVAGTFSNMARTGDAALHGLSVAALQSSQALGGTVTAATAGAAQASATAGAAVASLQQVAAAAVAAAGQTTAATTAAAAASIQQSGAAAAAAAAAAGSTAAATTAAAASTQTVAAAAGQIPATFRAASTAGTAAMGRLGASSTATTQQMAQAALANRNALRNAVAGVTQYSSTMDASIASAAAGTSRLSLATRLALGQATAASRATAAATTAAATRVSTSAHLLAAGATNAGAGAAAATARADANAAALAGTFGSATARARTMGSAVVTAAGSSEKALKSSRTASLALVAAFALAVYANSKFETSMSGVKAATQAQAKELGQLRQAAIGAGATTQYSATQAADAETELAKAGVSTSDILGGALKGTLNLAAAGQMDVADSAVVAAKAMNSFGLTGSDMAHIADVIAAAAGKSATDVHGMSLAFAQSSLLAHQTGLSLEETAGALALFAQNGLVGSDAGTSLKTMLMRLTPQSQQARDMMDKLGFSAYDSSGKFIGWSATAQALQKSLAGLTPEARNSALGIIFGSDAIRAATIVAKNGAAGVDQWTAAANDQGYAARYAATQTDNLSGDLRRLKSALETALIQSGTAANGVLRDMAKQLTAVIRWYSALPPGVQQSATVLAGVVGVVGLITSGLLLMLPRIMTTGRELSNLGITAARTRTLMMGLGRLALVVGALTAISYATDKITKAMEKAPPNVGKLTNSLVDLANSGKASGEVANSLGKNLDGFGDAVSRLAHPGNLTKVTDELGKIPLVGQKAGSLDEAAAKIKAVDQALASLVSNGNTSLADQAFKKLSKSANGNGTSTKKLMTMLPQYGDALTSASTQQKLGADSSKQLGDQAETTAADLQDTRTEVQKLSDALDTLNGNNINVAQSQIAFQQSLADFRTTVKDNGHSLDITTDKGRKVKSGFLDMADAAMKSAEAVAQQTGSQAAGNKMLQQDIDTLKKHMIQMGFSKATVDKLLASYAQIPGSKSTAVKVQDNASADLDAIRRKLTGVPGGKSITIKAPSAAVIADLKAVGYKVTTLPNHTIRISIPTSSQKAALIALKARIDALRDHTVVVTIRQQVKAGALSSQGGKNAIETNANGGIAGRAHAASGLFVPGYQPRVDSVYAMLSKGEGVLVPEAVRKLGALTGLGSAGVIKQLNAWGRYGSAMHFANGGIAGGSPQHFASGGFTYAPADPTATLGVSAGSDRYNAAVSKVNAAGKALSAALADAAKKATAVRDAERNLSRVRSGHHTASQLAAAEDKLTKARTASTAAAKKVAADRKTLNADDKALGVKAGTKTVTGFNLVAYEKQLAAANKANAAWEKNLAKIGGKAGQDVEGILRGMGSDGTALVAALAKATGSQFNKIVAQLKALAPAAQATLADYTAQLKSANTESATFQANLLKLAGMGDTALASQLAAQGDDAAAAIAAAAVKSASGASTANSAAAANAALLTSDDLAAAVTLLGVLKAKPGAGIADVLAAGLDWTTVRALAPKISSQIKAVSGSSAFVDQMRGQGVAMARGGILTKPTSVVAAEAGHTESWIPWDGSARSTALLSATAAAMGYQLVPAGRYAGSTSGGGAPVQHKETHHEWHLHGADQSFAEQKADLVRHMTFVG